MPRIPTVDSFNVTTRPTSGGGFSVPSAPRGDAIAAQQMGALGGAVQQAGGAMASIETDILERANRVRVDDALNQAKEAQLRLTHDKDIGFLSLKGEAAMPGEGRKPVSEDYAARFQDAITAAGKGLSNDAQRRAFEQSSGGMVATFRAGVQRHEAAELETYLTSTSESIVNTGLRDIAINARDQAEVDKASTRVRDHAWRLAQLKGFSAEWADQFALKAESHGHSLAMRSIIDGGDSGYAKAYLERYGSRMAPSDIIQTRAHLKDLDDKSAGMAAGDAAMRDFRPMMSPTPEDALRSITVQSGVPPAGLHASMVKVTMHTESRGRRYGADGKLLTSSAGAQGEMQVMPGTNRDPGYGVRPAQNDSPDELARVGRDYLGAMMKEYKGDPAKAWAAYNAGPGALNKAMKKGGENWLSLMPAETQAYVQKNMALLGQSRENGWRTAPEPTIEEVKARAVQALGANPSPVAREVAERRAAQAFEDHQKARKQQDEQNEAAVMKALDANGGRFDALPESVKSLIPPGKRDNLLAYGQKIRKGDDYTEPVVFQKVQDPEYLKSLSDDQMFALRHSLSESDWQATAKRRADLRKPGGDGSNKAGDLAGGINAQVDDMLRVYGVNPKPKDEADQARIGAIRMQVQQHILGVQARTGKQLSDAEMRTEVGGLFAKNGTTKGGWFSSGEQKPLLTMKASDIPSGAVDAIKAEWKKRGLSAPTEAQILSVYWTAMNKQTPKPTQTAQSNKGVSGGW